MADIANPIAIPTPRLDFRALSPELYRAQGGINALLARSSLGVQLLELVYLRVSQINGCAFCIDRHVSDARRAGEDERRIATLQAWRDTPFFSSRERAALAWAEALTSIADDHVSDALWESVQAEFSPADLVDLTLAVNAINGWNRFGIAFRKLPV